MKISDEIVPLRVLPRTIGATDFNRARLALRWLGRPLRVTLPEHRGLDVILDNQTWSCVDSCHEDRLILAWRSFAMAERQGLHESVRCELCFYHMHAGLIMGSALEQLSQALAQRLASYREVGVA